MQCVSNRCKELFKRKKYFGVIGTLSAEQRDGIANFIRSNDVLAVLPTGFGKSLAYTTSAVRDICTFAVLC